MFKAVGVALLRGASSKVRYATAAAADATAKKAPKERKTSANHGQNLAIKQPVSAALSEFMGVKETTRQEATSKVWKYIREHNLQSPDKKTEYLPDATLKKVLPEDVVTFATISRLLSKHFPQSAKKPKATTKATKTGAAEKPVPA